jgi:hypothetical protein
MYSLTHSIHKAVLCISGCCLYLGKVHVFADVVYTEGRSIYSLMYSVCILYLGQINVFADVFCS